jgi:hypothetical protein
MAYQTGDTILDTHYNGFVTSVNALWGQSTGIRGWGQTTTISTVADGNTITATQWATLLTRIKSISDHTVDDGNITVDSVTNPSTSDIISAITALATDIGTLDTSVAGGSVNASTGASTDLTLTSSGTFSSTIVHEATLTFDGGDEARYFFNAGGYIDVNPSISGGTTSVGGPSPAPFFTDDKYNEWADTVNTLIGSVRLRATTTEKNGGSGTPTIANNTGYYDLTTAYTVLYKQFSDTAPYTTNFWQLEAKVDTAHADGRGNNGAVVHLKCTWSDAETDNTSYEKNIYNVLDQVDGDKADVFAATPPATTFISATWGTLTWATITNSES